MRCITGKGKLLRKYIQNLSNKDNVVIFPENGLDINEQAEFISDLFSKINNQNKRELYAISISLYKPKRFRLI